jgi:hypothetical protein
MDLSTPKTIPHSPPTDREKRLSEMQHTLTKSKRLLTALYIQEKYVHDRSIT